MTRTRLLLLLILASTAFLEAQSVPDSSSGRTTAQRPFTDVDGDGIRDGAGTQKRQRATVRFKDADGDGICDGREKGLGFGRRRMSGGKANDPKNDGTSQRGKR